MSKKLRFIASSCFLLCILSQGSSAQVGGGLFTLPDSVCADHVFRPENVVSAENYFWSFCPPNYKNMPEGENTGIVQSLESAQSISLAKHAGIPYAFALNQNGILTQYKYEGGYNAPPTEVIPVGSFTGARGMHAVQDNDEWSVYVTVNNPNGFKLIRYDYNNGLQAPPTEVDMGSINAGIPATKELYIVKEGLNWRGFAFTQNDELLRLDFGMDRKVAPAVTNFGNINNQFDGANAITGVEEFGNWHLFVTNATSQTIVRLTFGNTLGNTPFAINLGTMGGRLKIPTGIAIGHTCEGFYGFVTNKGTSGLVLLKWEGSSIASPPVPQNYGNIAGFDQPVALSGMQEDSSSIFLFAGNTGNTFSKMEFKPCTESSIAGSDIQFPKISYSAPGVYTIYLTVNAGLPNERSDCKQIKITPHPQITVSNDTLICQADTIDLSTLTYGADSILWSPNYNIAPQSGAFVRVWPQHSQTYVSTVYFAPNCVVQTPIEVTVSEIRADAGPDRIISDGSQTILGGAETTIGSQYTYLWTPDVGIVGSTAAPVTHAIPPYNITYYLTVTNIDGCQKIDSVLVQTPCDKVNLPNAFTPESSYSNSNTFGISNLQFAKINYFKIFDRWGKEVFSTVDPNQRWDGKFDGKRVPMGVYVWEIDANCANTQERFRQSGTVTLIR